MIHFVSCCCIDISVHHKSDMTLVRLSICQLITVVNSTVIMRPLVMLITLIAPYISSVSSFKCSVDLFGREDDQSVVPNQPPVPWKSYPTVSIGCTVKNCHGGPDPHRSYVKCDWSELRYDNLILVTQTNEVTGDAYCTWGYTYDEAYRISTATNRYCGATQ